MAAAQQAKVLVFLMWVSVVPLLSGAVAVGYNDDDGLLPAKCRTDFDASQALRDRGLDPTEMVPPTHSWTDKYIIRKQYTPKVFCDGSGAGTEPGFFDPDEWGATGGHHHHHHHHHDDTHNDSDSDNGCCLYDYPAFEYRYCNAEHPGATFCEGWLPNRTLFAQMGDPDQDCDSWFYLTELMERTVTPRQIAEECQRRHPNENRVPFLQLSDVPQEEDSSSSWADKYIVEKGTQDMLCCGKENTANLLGCWSLETDEARWWKEADPASDLKSACSIQLYPSNTYEYCDKEARTLAICYDDGTSVNQTFLDEYGFVGQDCTSWELLLSYIGKELTLDDLQAECRAAKQS